METQVSNLIRSLASFIEEESTTRLPDVRRKIRRLQRTLELISAILPDAERRRMLEETIKLWSKELKEVIYDAEDLIDRYTLELPQFPEQQAPVRRYQFRLFNWFTSVAKELKEVIYDAEDLIDRYTIELPQFPDRYQFRLFNWFTSVANHEVGIRIEEINNRLKKIAKDGAIYQLQPSEVVSEEIVSHPRKSPIVPKVGIEEEARALARLLLNPLKPGNQVLAITGMGGIGKTTLAEKIYSAPEIKQHFHIRIWVLVSQHFKEADLLRGIISSAAYSAEVGDTRQELQQILSGVIKGRRFLIVLDDVRSADVWENVLQDPLQSGAPGSRVLITTRNEDIAKQMGVVMIHNVRPLGIEDSWFLLRKTASVVDEGEMEWLSHIGMEIVHKCEGVPLALKAIGCVLRDKELSQHEWSKVLEYLKINRVPPMPPLYLSYEALPSSAKPCFLYCSLLPENQMIAHRDLMQMWISEGFVELHSSAGMPEDLAEAYCATIAATNLLELKSNGNETDHSCRIHDVIRDLAISLTKDDNYSGDLSQLGNTRTRVRRLSIGSRKTILSPDVITCHTGLRSLLIFDNLLSDNMLRDLVDQLSYLRVLNLQGSAIQEVPSSLGTLFHLRYLNLSGTRIRHLPESIKDLQNLLFLNLHGCMDLERIPNGITELYNLRSLDILHTNLDDMPSGIRAMRHLNTLVGFVPGNCALEELEYLEQIRYLHVRKLDRVVKGGAHLRNKNNLRSLVLSWEQDASQAFDQYEIEDILNDLGPPASLEQLTIECYSRPDYPGWMSSPSYCPNLVGLNLKSCKFSTSLPSLGQLPKLKNLCISASKGIVTLGTEFFGNSGLPFPKLESLVIEEMDNWEEWSGPSDRKTLPVFREMHLKKCPKLRSLPHCLRFSTALTKLVVEAADSIRMIEDLHFVTELSIKDCPNLERISYLTALKTLEIVRCPLLQDLGDAEVLQHLILEDFTLESLPRWLAANKLMNLRMLEITGNHDLLKSLQMMGPERHKIATVPYVYVYSTGNSRSIASLPVAKRNQSASLPTSLPLLKSVEIHEIATEESKSNTSPPNATEKRNQSASLPTSLPLLKKVEIHEIATEESKSNTSPPNATEERNQSASLPTSLPLLKSVEIHEIATEESKSNTSPPNATEEKQKKVDSLSSLNTESSVRLHVPVREPQRRVGSLHLTVNQIYSATKNFSDSLRLGIGTVYKGVLLDGQVIAVKRVEKNNLLRDGFRDEVELLSQIQHPNLVKILGCTEAHNELFIIMEYVSNGDLREHLDGLRGKILDFNQRLKIALEVAQALTYLHSYAEKTIIHQNVGSSHILLTEGYVAKVSSFGLARFDRSFRYPKWYRDPEYLLTKQLTSKGVFSFGILLLEVVSGRRPVEPKLVADENVIMKKFSERRPVEPKLVADENVTMKIFSERRPVEPMRPADEKDIWIMGKPLDAVLAQKRDLDENVTMKIFSERRPVEPMRPADEVDIWPMGKPLDAVLAQKRDLDSAFDYFIRRNYEKRKLKRPADENVTIKWALTEYNEGRLRGILDPKLTEVVDEEALQKMLALAFDCAAPISADRPPMTLVRDRLSEIMNDYEKSHGK